MTALVGDVVKRIFSGLARQSTGLPGLKTHQTCGENFANFG